jgi:hypothetical protein
MTVIDSKIEGTDQAFCVAVFVSLRSLGNETYLKKHTASADGPFEAKVSEIARWAGLGYNTCERVLPLLCGIGVLQMQRNFLEGTKAKTASRFTFPVLGATVPHIAGKTFPTEATPLRADIIEEGKEEVKTSNNQSAPDAVGSDSNKRAEAIYEAYPRKASRPRALAAIVAALSKTDAETLLAAVTAYATATAKWEEHEQQFIPAPAKWFTDERYADDPTTWQRHGKTGNNRTGQMTVADHAGAF